MMVETHAFITSIARAILNPALIGAVVFVIYVLAWNRMEYLSDKRRRAMNERLTGELVSIETYVEDTSGDALFIHTSFTEVVNHMRSKGRIPLQFSDRCQPFVPAPSTEIFWQSECVALRETPRLEMSELFEAVVYRARLSMDEVLDSVTNGGKCLWKDSRGIFGGKESTYWIQFDFHDGNNFFAIFIDNRYNKRVVSMRVSEFLDDEVSFDFETKSITFPQSKLITSVKIPDNTLLLSIATLYCHSIPRWH
jgi:hypothetical protein